MLHLCQRIFPFINASFSYPGPQVVAVNISHMVGSGSDILAVVNPQIGQQHKQLVIITHLKHKSKQNENKADQLYTRQGHILFL